MQKKWNAFCRKIDTDTEDYGTVLRKINNFLAKPFMAAVTDNDLTEHWISSVNEWRKKEFHMAKIMEIIEKETRGKIRGELVLRKIP